MTVQPNTMIFAEVLTTTAARIEIYADGSCIPNPGPGGWGIVALLTDAADNVLDVQERKGEGKGSTTNNRAEMAAGLNALAFAKSQIAAGLWPDVPVTIISDSQLLIKGMTQWLPGWVARGWRKADGKQPDNRDLWERPLAATEGMSVEWRSVKGHSGNSWNERADALARTAAEQAQSLRRGISRRA